MGALLRIALVCCRAFVHLFRIADTLNDISHMFNRDSFNAIRFQFAKEFGYTVFNVVGYFIAAFALAKVAAHIVKVLLKQFASIVINGIQSAKEVDSNILCLVLNKLTLY